MGVVISKPAINLREQLTELKAQQGYEERQFWFDGLVDTANDAASWTAYGTNTVADVGDAVEVTYVDNANGAYVRLRENGGLSTDLVVGKTYQVNLEVKVNSGIYGVRIYNGSSYEVADSPLTNTTYVAKSYTITPTSATGAFLDFSNLSSGEVVSIRNISVYEADPSDNKTIHTMPKGWKPLHVFEDGALQREGSAYDYTVEYDGFNYVIKETVAPVAPYSTTVIGVRA